MREIALLRLFDSSIHPFIHPLTPDIYAQEAGEGMTTHYSLADTMYAKADVECNGTVCLWLGVRGLFGVRNGCFLLPPVEVC